MSLVLNSGFTIGPGVVLHSERTILPFVETGLLLHLDAGNPASYPGSGTSWTDLVNSKVFTLYNGPTYSGTYGGYLEFEPNSSQFAEATSFPSSLSTWSVEAWFYYNATWTGASPCIVTEVYTGSPINFTLGNGSDTAPYIQAGFFDGAWRITPQGNVLSVGWHHLVGTWDGTSIKLYVDGALLDSSTPGGTSTQSGSGIRLMNRWDVGQYQGGRLAVVRIYDNDIGSTGVATNFNASRARFEL